MTPEQRGELLRRFLAALDREQQLRTLVEGKGPGTPSHDPKMWGEYLAALDATTQASQDYRQRLA
jgi:hypothetical protein